MQQTWIFYALGGLLALGLGDFIKKLVLKKGGNKEVFLLMCFIFYIPFFWVNMLLQGTGNFTPDLLRGGFIMGIFNFFIPLGVLTAFKYLDISFALVSIRITSSFFILFIGVRILGDHLSLYNYLGFILGVISIFLLSGFKLRAQSQLHPKGVIAIIIVIVSIVLSNSYFKQIVPNINIHDFMPIQFSVTGLSLILYMILRKKFISFNKIECRKVLPYAFITLGIFAIHFLYFLPNMYILGPLSLSYKMLSYSLIVPIILSVIFLGEQVSKKKLLAFALTLLSIFLFI